MPLAAVALILAIVIAAVFALSELARPRGYKLGRDTKNPELTDDDRRVAAEHHDFPIP
jgi:hypothetical protein